MNYYFTKKSNLDFDQVIENISVNLKAEGFGIVTRMEVDKTLYEKIGVDFRKYTILGFCNPTFAHQALLQDDKIGALLPCNVMVQQHEDGIVEVSAINPSKLFEVIDNNSFAEMADHISNIFRTAIENI
jgi:uncharacterized protein (DUF302 family)